MLTVSEQLQVLQYRIEEVLVQILPSVNTIPVTLHQSMHYSVLDGGKRIRPLLLYATGHALGLSNDILDIPAASVELIHTYSLIHDDLPAMDDDDLRRGKLSNHRAFDEATAILAGDSLQTLAFHLLSAHPDLNISATQRLKLLQILTSASGSYGMVGGQAIDLSSVGKVLMLKELEQMHQYKTGALIRASVLMAAHCDLNITPKNLQGLDTFAQCIGLAFQVRDDILDVESNTEILGKSQGADIAADKPTYPSMLGMHTAKQTAIELHQQALTALQHFGHSANLLREIAHFIVKRLK